MLRSVRRADRMASVPGRPSRRKKLPGILPTAYSRSSNSTVRGRKSIPSRAWSDITAVASRMVSPQVMVTAPWACWASRPVSRVMGCPPISPSMEKGFINSWAASIVVITAVLSTSSSIVVATNLLRVHRGRFSSWVLNANSAAVLRSFPTPRCLVAKRIYSIWLKGVTIVTLRMYRATGFSWQGELK